MVARPLRISPPQSGLDDDPERAEASGAPACALCSGGPAGEHGHGGLKPSTDLVDRRAKERMWLVFTCGSCRARWARERLRARHYRWIRVL
jgi:hypothetical protein